jgi:hypothetical protein
MWGVISKTHLPERTNNSVFFYLTFISLPFLRFLNPVSSLQRHTTSFKISVRKIAVNRATSRFEFINSLCAQYGSIALVKRQSFQLRTDYRINSPARKPIKKRLLEDACHLNRSERKKKFHASKNSYFNTTELKLKLDLFDVCINFMTNDGEFVLHYNPYRVGREASI